MIPEESSIPIGDKFLLDISIKELEKMRKKEKDVRASNRLLAYKLRKKGLSIRGIGSELGKCYSTIRGWLIRAVQTGVEGRYDIKQEGTPERLSLEQKDELLKDLIAGPKECGFTDSTWNGKLVQKYIKKKFNVFYSSRSTIYKIMHEIGFSPQTASETRNKK